MAKSIQNEQTTLYFPACFHSCFRTLASRHSSSSTPTMKALRRHRQSRSSIISRRHAAGQLRPTCHPVPASCDITYLSCSLNVSAFSHHAAAHMLGRRNTMPPRLSLPSDRWNGGICLSPQTDTNKLTLVVGVTPPCGEPLICCCSVTDEIDCNEIDCLGVCARGSKRFHRARPSPLNPTPPGSWPSNWMAAAGQSLPEGRVGGGELLPRRVNGSFRRR